MTVRVLVPLAAGAEEMEVVIVVDVLRRAGVDVVAAGLADAEAVTCSRGVVITPDCSLADAHGEFDMIVLPGGGPGSMALAESADVQRLLTAQDGAGRWIGAICAAPIALVAAGVGKGRPFTSHPSVAGQVAGHGEYREDRVVRDGNLITSRGPGTAMEFALELVAALCGSDAARKVAGPMLPPGG